MVTVLLHPYLPSSTEALLAALGHARPGARGRPLRRARRRRGRAPDRAPLPEAVIDSHTHLESCEPEAADLVAEAERAGVAPPPHRRHRRRVVPRRARRGGGLPAGLRGDRPPPQRGEGLRRRRPRRAASARRPRALPRDRRDRARLLPRPRAPRRPGARLRRADRARARDRQAAGHPHPGGRRRHDLDARRARGRGHGHPPLLLDARAACASASTTAGGSPSPGTSPTRSPPRSRTLRARFRSTACSSRPTRPILTPQAVRKERNQPAFVVHTARFLAELRGIEYAELEAAVEGNAAALFGW